MPTVVARSTGSSGVQSFAAVHSERNLPMNSSPLASSPWFQDCQSQKKVYIDGHEREDGVRHRESLLKILKDLRSSHQPLPCCCDEPLRVRLEANDEKSWSSFSTMNRSLTRMRDRRGCGERENDLPFFQKPKAVALWSLILLRNMVST